jgi:molybdate transport repressor ModE-like protein
MHKIAIKPQWTIRRPDGQALPPRLLDLLVQVHETGSLASACQRMDASYRHAWDLVRQGEAIFGAPLLQMERGKGSRLTALGEKLVWADRRISARLTPLLETLASELETEIQRLVSSEPALLRIHASHGFAIEALFDFLTRAQVVLERRYCGSLEAVASLAAGTCDVAGFHIPLGEFEASAVTHYARWFDARSQRIVNVATRRQGLIVAPGNPRKLYEVADLARPDVRFINRQPGSGTRFLLDQLLHKAGVDPERINGYEQGEYTHAAVAAYVASGMADAAFGVEPPARQFRLDFIPIASERYFLLCNEPSLAKPQFRTLLDILSSTAYIEAVDKLPGYSATGCGTVATLRETFSQYRPAK